MNLLFFLSVSLSTFSLALSLINYFSMRVVKSTNSEIEESVSILIPMRNEEENVDELMLTLSQLSGLKNFEIKVLDDRSDDQTREKLERYQGLIKVLDGTELPSDWLGKPFACSQLARECQAEFFVFLDADVRLSPTAISSAISEMKRLNWDFISPYPAQKCSTLLMNLIQPLLQWSWFASVPLRFAESGKISSMVIANGQFFLVRQHAYVSVGGHQSVKSEVLEDLSLARTLSRAGFRGGVAEASSVAECTMYKTNVQMVRGYTKSLWRAFGGISGTLLTTLLLCATQLLPIILLGLGNTLALIPLFAVSATHLLAAIRTRSRPINALLHPAAAGILIGLIVDSYWRKARGTLEWRGRRVA
jgi:cellulose synthase/poly-beta-1,6-N-acetylglucosamine synthase-like glycosyltransferase